jgi:heme-degrading monooxygenase HmoA
LDSEEIAMFIAMNRFRVKKGSEADFEAVWRNRQSYIAREPGFVEFHVLRGPAHEDHTLYASHTVWASEADFLAWTRSQAFRDAHKDAGRNAALYIGSPAFEGFSVVQTVTR